MPTVSLALMPATGLALMVPVSLAIMPGVSMLPVRLAISHAAQDVCQDYGKVRAC
jgi:hypothetical protein